MWPSLCSFSFFSQTAVPNREALDLIAQQSMACWAQGQFWVSLLGAAVSFLALTGLLVSLNQTRRSLADARVATRAQIRPYIIIDNVVAKIVDLPLADSEWERPTVLGSDISRLEIEITARVGGQSPAHHILSSYKLVPFFESEAKSYQQDGKYYIGSQLPGDKTIVFGMSWPTGDEHDEILMAKRAFDISGTIDYQDAFGSKYETKYAFSLGEHSAIAGEGKELIADPDPERTSFS